MSATVEPEKILKDLANLWVELGREAGDGGSTGVLRACTMTLVVVADQADDAQAIGETLAQLMPEHPSRAIVVRVNASPERALESRVFSQCWTAFGERRHICAEQIEITSSEAALAEVPSVVLPLVAPDLPVLLWFRSARLFDLAGFADLHRLATKIVLDSAAFPSPAAAFERLQSILRGGCAAGDLAWTRLTCWRETVARVFEHRGGLAQAAELKVTDTGASGLYMAAWLMDGFERAGAKPRLTLAAGERRIEIAAPGSRIRIGRGAGRCAEVSVNDEIAQTPMPEPVERALMAEEMGIPGHDPVFERTLSAAQRLALS